MPNLSRAIEHTYPGIKPGVDFTLQNDGQGDYIKTWNYTGAGKPNETDLAALASKFDDVVALEREKRELISEKLAKTDWYYIRNMRTGKKVPDDIANQNSTVYGRVDEIDAEIAVLLS